MVPKYFFTSDTHFNHGNIIKYSNRPFLSQKDKEELTRSGAWHDGVWKSSKSSRWRMTQEAVSLMDDTLINEINSIVGENDVLWHLGDFAFADKHNYYSTCRGYRDRIKCRNVNIIWGNHDDRKIRDLFNEAYDLKMVSLPNQTNRVVLCHYSLAIWDGSHRQNIHLYGHSHSEAEVSLESKFPGRRSMDVGVDNAAKLLGKYRPFTLEEIQNIMSVREGHNLGDHHINPNSSTKESFQ